MLIFKTVFFVLLILSFTNTDADNIYLKSSVLEDNYPEKCTVLLLQFAEHAANFTLCSIQFARPIRLCEQCVNSYVLFSEKYEKLMTENFNGTSCKDLYLSQDRLEAVLSYYNNIKAIWNRGHCTDCFEWPKNTTSDRTERFIRMFNEVNDCIRTTNNLNLNNTKKICENCMQSYIQLDEFYKSMSADAIGVDSICMDVVDRMNTTRSIWSKDLGCCQRKTPEVIFLCCTGIISALPVLFYLAVRYCGPIRDLPNVLRQSRFKQTFQRNDRSD